MSKQFVVKEIGSKEFHIHSTALAIFALLNSFEVSGLTVDEGDHIRYSVDIHSYPWYNGRERGICLTIAYRSKQLNITFGEVRNSDSIFVDVWETATTFNPPTSDDFTAEAYEQRNYFRYDEHYKASRFIQELVEARVNDCLKEYRDRETIKEVK
jgi:hypothetical protein